jgi:hypothetical protein
METKNVIISITAGIVVITAIGVLINYNKDSQMVKALTKKSSDILDVLKDSLTNVIGKFTKEEDIVNQFSEKRKAYHN